MSYQDEVEVWGLRRDLSRIDYSVDAIEEKRARLEAVRTVNITNLVKVAGAAVNEMDLARQQLTQENPRIAAELQRLQDIGFIGVARGISRYAEGR